MNTEPKSSRRSFGIAALTLTTLSIATFGVAQQQDRQSDTQFRSRTDKRYFSLDDLRGAMIRAGNNASVQPGNATKGTTGGQSMLGTIVDVSVAEPNGVGSHGNGNDQRPATGAASHGSAKAIVQLSTVPDQGAADASARHDTATGRSKQVAIPLGDLEWNGKRRYFTCSKSASDLHSMPEWKSDFDRDAQRGKETVDRGRAQEHSGERGADAHRGRNAGTGRMNGTLTRFADGSLRASWIARATLRTEDGRQSDVAGLVVDLQEGSLAYLLARRTHDVADSGNQDQTGTTDRTGQRGEACIVPYDVLDVDRRAAGAGRSDVEDADVGKGVAAQPAIGLVFSVPMTSSELQGAPKIDPSDLSALTGGGLVEKIRDFYAKAK